MDYDIDSLELKSQNLKGFVDELVSDVSNQFESSWMTKLSDYGIDGSLMSEQKTLADRILDNMSDDECVVTNSVDVSAVPNAAGDANANVGKQDVSVSQELPSYKASEISHLWDNINDSEVRALIQQKPDSSANVGIQGTSASEDNDTSYVDLKHPASTVVQKRDVSTNLIQIQSQPTQCVSSNTQSLDVSARPVVERVRSTTPPVDNLEKTISDLQKSVDELLGKSTPVAKDLTLTSQKDSHSQNDYRINEKPPSGDKDIEKRRYISRRVEELLEQMDMEKKERLQSSDNLRTAVATSPIPEASFSTSLHELSEGNIIGGFNFGRLSPVDDGFKSHRVHKHAVNVEGVSLNESTFNNTNFSDKSKSSRAKNEEEYRDLAARVGKILKENGIHSPSKESESSYSADSSLDFTRKPTSPTRKWRSKSRDSSLNRSTSSFRESSKKDTFKRISKSRDSSLNRLTSNLSGLRLSRSQGNFVTTYDSGMREPEIKIGGQLNFKLSKGGIASKRNDSSNMKLALSFDGVSSLSIESSSPGVESVDSSWKGSDHLTDSGNIRSPKDRPRFTSSAYEAFNRNVIEFERMLRQSKSLFTDRLPLTEFGDTIYESDDGHDSLRTPTTIESSHFELIKISGSDDAIPPSLPDNVMGEWTPRRQRVQPPHSQGIYHKEKQFQKEDMKKKSENPPSVSQSIRLADTSKIYPSDISHRTSSDYRHWESRDASLISKQPSVDPQKEHLSYESINELTEDKDCYHQIATSSTQKPVTFASVDESESDISFFVPLNESLVIDTNQEHQITSPEQSSSYFDFETQQSIAEALDESGIDSALSNCRPLESPSKQLRDPDVSSFTDPIHHGDRDLRNVDSFKKSFLAKKEKTNAMLDSLLKSYPKEANLVNAWKRYDEERRDELRRGLLDSSEKLHRFNLMLCNPVQFTVRKWLHSRGEESLMYQPIQNTIAASGPKVIGNSEKHYGLNHGERNVSLKSDCSACNGQLEESKSFEDDTILSSVIEDSNSQNSTSLPCIQTSSRRPIPSYRLQSRGVQTTDDLFDFNKKEKIEPVKEQSPGFFPSTAPPKARLKFNKAFVDYDEFSSMFTEPSDNGLLSSKENVPRGTRPATLQEAFLLKKSDFIIKSRRRQRELKMTAQERRINAYRSTNESTRPPLAEKHPQKIRTSHPLSDVHYHGTRRIITKDEMKERTNRVYQNLPEVIAKKKFASRQGQVHNNKINLDCFKAKLKSQTKAKQKSSESKRPVFQRGNTPRVYVESA